MIEDESEEPSGVDTPTVAEEKTMAANNGTSEAGGPADGNEKEKAVAPPPKAAELPTEVRTKLRKLEKLESKYQGIRSLR